MDWREHIERRPDVMVGKPVIKGTRLTVELILERLPEGESEADLIEWERLALPGKLLSLDLDEERRFEYIEIHSASGIGRNALGGYLPEAERMGEAFRRDEFRQAMRRRSTDGKQAFHALR